MSKYLACIVPQSYPETCCSSSMHPMCGAISNVLAGIGLPLGLPVCLCASSSSSSQSPLCCTSCCPLRQYLNRKLGSTWCCCRLSSACLSVCLSFTSPCLSTRLPVCSSVCVCWLPPLATPWAQRRAGFHCKPRTELPPRCFHKVSRRLVSTLKHTHTHTSYLRHAN